MYYPFYGKGSLGTGSNRFSIKGAVICTISQTGWHHSRGALAGMGNRSIRFTEVKHTMTSSIPGARCSSVVRAFAHGAMDRRIDI